MWQLNPSTRKRERRSWLFEIEIMAVVESTSGVDLAATGSPLTGGGVAPDPRSPKGLVSASDAAGLSVLRSHPDASDAFHAKLLRAQDPTRDGSSSASAAAPRPNGVAPGGEGFKREMRDLVELLSKLNPMAEEFVPPSLAGMGNSYGAAAGGSGEFYASDSGMSDGVGNGGAVGIGGRRKKNGYGHGKRRMNSRTSLAQRDEVIRRTVYVSDIDHQVTEEQLATLFINCGPSDDEREMCSRTVYCTNIDKKAESATAALNCSGVVLGSLPIRLLCVHERLALPCTESWTSMWWLMIS
ncbi:RNA recognition motif containing protein [Musa troglodytarum]|uniref:RNA recognition motif containing protein n=1 Tax=Musa troglodytarum TaxID=320322 RepID=A0A9E7LDL0_9LILI|nr:RNA recognition motif containing protein [Musa troglodytarum]